MWNCQEHRKKSFETHGVAGTCTFITCYITLILVLWTSENLWKVCAQITSRRFIKKRVMQWISTSCCQSRHMATNYQQQLYCKCCNPHVSSYRGSLLNLNLRLHHLRHLSCNFRWCATCCTDLGYSGHHLQCFDHPNRLARLCPWRVPLSNWTNHVATSVRSCSKISFCPFRTRVWRMAQQVCSEHLGQTQTSELSALECWHGMEEDVFHCIYIYIIIYIYAVRKWCTYKTLVILRNFLQSQSVEVLLYLSPIRLPGHYSLREWYLEGPTAAWNQWWDWCCDVHCWSWDTKPSEAPVYTDFLYILYAHYATSRNITFI